ncbi:hypothetical protein ACIBJC_22735 [Streptomyces sp. NPDC050509]|uniref:hypothetical protein n=1 Tax=Streptomyces sp. NPDC050509 TaxID=3365620 RepID=UPI00378D02C5
MSVRRVGSEHSPSGAGADVYGCSAHAGPLAAALDDVLADLEWLIASRAGRIGHRDPA